MRKSLAERCEQATGPDRELDQELAKAAGWVEVQGRHYSVQSCIEPDGTKHPHGLVSWAPKYTASLDSAMSLVPEGFAWALSKDKPYGPEGRADAVLNDTVFTKNAVIAQAATPALALCAAALRAKEKGA